MIPAFTIVHKLPLINKPFSGIFSIIITISNSLHHQVFGHSSVNRKDNEYKKNEVNKIYKYAKEKN